MHYLKKKFSCVTYTIPSDNEETVGIANEIESKCTDLCEHCHMLCESYINGRFMRAPCCHLSLMICMIVSC